MKTKKKIHVGMLISYDYGYAPTALGRIYDRADHITLAIDRNRRTWAGGNYTLGDDFFRAIELLDTDRKIEIYEDDFCLPGLSPLENDTRERNMLAERMGPSDDRWHVQVDSDEYFVDFGAFVDLLHSLDGHKKPVEVWGEMMVLFRHTGDGFLYIENGAKPERVALATNYPRYDRARTILDPRVTHLRTDHIVLHQSWARPEAEIKQKLDSWGHKTDFVVEDYFRFWQGVDRYNAPFLRNIHPFAHRRDIWRALRFVEGGIDDIIAARLAEGYHPWKRITARQRIVAAGRKLNKKLHGK